MINNTFKNISKYAKQTGIFEDNKIYQTPLTENIGKLDEYLLCEIYQINNGLVNLTPEYIHQITKLINDTFPNKEIYWYALSTSKYFPKEVLLNEAVTEKNEKLRYALFQRDDLTKKEIKFLIDLIKPANFREFLSDKNAYIHPHNVDILCNLSQTDQRKMEYRCYSRLCDECFWFGKITELLNDVNTISLNSHKNDIELIVTALLDNPNISDKFKEKMYQHHGIAIEYSNCPPKNILKDIYPSIADIICDEKLGADKKLLNNAIDTMARYFKNNALSDAMICDFLRRVSVHPKYNKANFYKIKNVVETVAETDAMKKAIEIDTPDMIFAVMRNKNFSSELLRKIKPKIDFYMAYPKTEMHSLFITSMIDTVNGLKITDMDECMKYIDKQDAVAIKLMLANPYISTDVLRELKKYVNELSVYEGYDSFNVLFDLRLALKDATSVSRQFLMHKFLEFQLEEKPVTSTDEQPDFITSDLFFKKHNFVNNDEMFVGGFDTIHTRTKIENLIKKYELAGKDTETLKKLYNYIEGYKEYRYFTENQYKILTEEKGKFKLDIELLYEKYKENKEKFSNDFFKLSNDFKKIFLQEFSKELVLCNHKELRYKNSELLVNILMDMEGFYQKLTNEVDRDINAEKETVKSTEKMEEGR